MDHFTKFTSFSLFILGFVIDLNYETLSEIVCFYLFACWEYSLSLSPYKAELEFSLDYFVAGIW